MDVSSLLAKSGTLLSHMREASYSEGYIEQVAREVRWLAANGGLYETFETARDARVAESDRRSTRKGRRVALGIVEDFVVRAMLPEFSRRSAARPSSRGKLCEGMAAVVDAYLERAALNGNLGMGTMLHYASVTSSFLLDTQDLGRACLAEVTEAVRCRQPHAYDSKTQ
ncbi:MAG: hypothetical protein IKG18_14175 [Atopobiaceae bacterium]|nr:hypothetical protein [Atopobiaceae bacterium]